MSRVVLDASALLTLLNREPGVEKLTLSILKNFVISTVNLAEVHGKLIQRGLPANDAWSAASATFFEAIPFDSEHARIAGDLLAHTHSQGLSLGDRACLALGITLQSPVYTADRAWKKLDLGIPIHVIR